MMEEVVSRERTPPELVSPAPVRSVNASEFKVNEPAVVRFPPT